jgi:hypothetical protein
VTLGCLKAWECLEVLELLQIREIFLQTNTVDHKILVLLNDFFQSFLSFLLFDFTAKDSRRYLLYIKCMSHDLFRAFDNPRSSRTISS